MNEQFIQHLSQVETSRLIVNSLDPLRVEMPIVWVVSCPGKWGEDLVVDRDSLWGICKADVLSIALPWYPATLFCIASLALSCYARASMTYSDLKVVERQSFGASHRERIMSSIAVHVWTDSSTDISLMSNVTSCNKGHMSLFPPSDRTSALAIAWWRPFRNLLRFGSDFRRSKRFPPSYEEGSFKLLIRCSSSRGGQEAIKKAMISGSMCSDLRTVTVIHQRFGNRAYMRKVRSREG